jgi:VWFA-related protein
MKMRNATPLILMLLAGPVFSSTKLIVTVTEQKTGRPVEDLKAQDFSVLDDKTPRQVESVEVTSGLVDIMLLLDTSLVGGMVQPLAANLISQLQEKEQMAIVSFHSSADLIQDFTSSKQLLEQAIGGVKYGNTPHVLDSLYASIGDGFQGSAFRRVVLLLTTGLEGPSRVTERDVVRLARKNGVSIFPIYVVGSERSLFEQLARQTGGASFRVNDMKRAGLAQPGPVIFGSLRKHYVVTISGNFEPGEKLKVTVNRPDKLSASAMPVE